MNINKFSFLIILFIFSANSYSVPRKYINKQFTPYLYEVSISKNFSEAISPLNFFIKSSIKGYNNRKQEKLLGRIYDITYTLIEERLENDCQIDILPVNTFQDKIKYNEYKYPDASIKKAQRISYTNFYFKIEIEMDAKSHSEVGNTICPQVHITLSIYDKVGILPIDRAKGAAHCIHPFTISEDLLAGISSPLSRDEVMKRDNAMMKVIYTAIDRLIADL